MTDTELIFTIIILLSVLSIIHLTNANGELKWQLNLKEHRNKWLQEDIDSLRQENEILKKQNNYLKEYVIK
jgi:cell division protein FtsB